MYVLCMVTRTGSATSTHKAMCDYKKKKPFGPLIISISYIIDSSTKPRHSFPTDFRIRPPNQNRVLQQRSQTTCISINNIWVKKLSALEKWCTDARLF